MYYCSYTDAQINWLVTEQHDLQRKYAMLKFTGVFFLQKAIFGKVKPRSHEGLFKKDTKKTNKCMSYGSMWRFIAAATTDFPTTHLFAISFTATLKISVIPFLVFLSPLTFYISFHKCLHASLFRKVCHFFKVTPYNLGQAFIYN